MPGSRTAFLGIQNKFFKTFRGTATLARLALRLALRGDKASDQRCVAPLKNNVHGLDIDCKTYYSQFNAPPV
jgi:hypothetical protein